MNIAIIGLGSIGRRHLKCALYLKDELKLGHIRGYDIDIKRRKDAEKEIPGVVTYSTLAETIEGAETVFICVPTSIHIAVINEIQQLGDFNLFIEKPLSHKIDGCDNLIFTQKRKKKITSVGYLLQFHPAILQAKDLIEEGTIGRILSIRAECGQYLPKWHPWEDYRDFYMSWKSGGGGALLDISHEINYMQYLAGPVTEVKGYFDTISDLDISSDDIAIGLMRFKNGAYGQVQLDLLQFDVSRKCKIIGTKGTIKIDLKNGTLCYHTLKEEEWKTLNFKVEGNEGYHEEWRRFIFACRGEKVYYVTIEDARHTMDVVEGIRRSHEYGNAIRLPLY